MVRTLVHVHFLAHDVPTVQVTTPKLRWHFETLDLFIPCRPSPYHLGRTPANVLAQWLWALFQQLFHEPVDVDSGSLAP